jgi:4-amino-4-deoxy-L-arabinose transferase-like glycosyltransferase
MKSSFLYPFLFACFFVSLIALEGILCRPLLPVDETRYVTVAWEMFLSKNWILPTLNFEAYHHKPPLLFWIITSLWSIFGPLQGVAQAVPYIIFMGLIGANMYLAKSLFPRDERAPTWMMILTLGSFPLLIYSNLIMFDLLLTVFTILSLASIWNFAKTGNIKHILFLALCIGLGGLAKGPVILLNIIFPILFYPFWAQREIKLISNPKWYGLTLTAILGGIGIALLWAIPAALQGGEEYANKIFWGQTAGRVENSFDHGRPIWWYLPLLPILLCPWIFMPKLWRNILRWPETSIYLDSTILRFLFIWVVPVFVCFSLISGKQVHYLFPCLIGVFVFIGMLISNDKALEKKRDIILPAAIITFLISVPAILKLFAIEMSELFNRHLMDDVFLRITAIYSVGGALLAIGLFILVRNQPILRQLMAMALSMVIFMGVLHLEGEKSFYKNYDLTPMAKIINQNKGRPMAFLRNYHGEWGFMARLDHPVEQILPEDLPAWFKKYPNGIAFLRTSKEQEFRGKYDVIFEMPYKMNNTFTILVPKGMGQKFVHSQQ